MMPTFDLLRFDRDPVRSRGALCIGGLHHCYTLEPPWMGNLPDISCVPSGLYHVSWTLSRRLRRHTWELIDVPGRTGIRIHVMNYPHDTTGCIGFGYTLWGKDKIGQSAKAIRHFNTMMHGIDVWCLRVWG